MSGGLSWLPRPCRPGADGHGRVAPTFPGQGSHCGCSEQQLWIQACCPLLCGRWGGVITSEPQFPCLANRNSKSPFFRQSLGARPGTEELLCRSLPTHAERRVLRTAGYPGPCRLDQSGEARSNQGFPVGEGKRAAVGVEGGLAGLMWGRRTPRTGSGRFRGGLSGEGWRWIAVALGRFH